MPSRPGMAESRSPLSPPSPRTPLVSHQMVALFLTSSDGAVGLEVDKNRCPQYRSPWQSPCALKVGPPCPFLHPVTPFTPTLSILIRDGEVRTLYMARQPQNRQMVSFPNDPRVARFPPLPLPWRRAPESQRYPCQSLIHSRCRQALVLEGGLACNSSRSSITCTLARALSCRRSKRYHRCHHCIEKGIWYVSHTRHCPIRRCVDSRGGVTIGPSLATMRFSCKLLLVPIQV